MNVTKESLEKKHGEKAGDVYREIAAAGGFGNVPEHYSGGLDLTGVLADSNSALSGKEKDHIASLAGVTRAQATAIVDDKTGGQSSAHKMQSKEK